MITYNTEAGFAEDAPERVTFFSFQDDRRYKAGYLRLIKLSRHSLTFCTRHPSRNEHRCQMCTYDYVIREVFSHVKRSIYINKRLFGIAENTKSIYASARRRTGGRVRLRFLPWSNALALFRSRPRGSSLFT